MPGRVKMSEDTKLLVNLFLPFYAIHCSEHIYLVYGNVLKEYGLSPALTGWILGIYFLMGMCARPLGGWLLENIGVRRTLIWSGAMCFAGGAALFLTKSAPILLAGRALSGAGFGIYTTGIFAHQAMSISEKMRGAGLSLLVTGGMLPMATVTPLGEWFLLGSHEKIYLAMGPIISALCWYLGGRVKMPAAAERRGDGEKRWGTYRGLLTSRTFLILILTGIIIALVDAIIVDVSMLAAENGLAASYFLMSGSIAAVVVRVAGSSLINVLPRSVLLAPCGIVMSGSMILISFLPSNGAFVAGGILYGVGIGAGWPMLHAILSDTLEPALRPKGTAMALLFYDAGFFLTPLIVGYLSPAIGMAWALTAISLVSGAALAVLEILYWIPLRRMKREGRPLN
ncbi:MAG: MFS transporter [Synergistaceae bacterium]|jgi:MFS family permease|nr:MFS transporter [Synergistaceae bacterium]